VGQLLSETLREADAVDMDKPESSLDLCDARDMAADLSESMTGKAGDINFIVDLPGPSQQAFVKPRPAFGRPSRHCGGLPTRCAASRRDFGRHGASLERTWRLFLR